MCEVPYPGTHHGTSIIKNTPSSFLLLNEVSPPFFFAVFCFDKTNGHSIFFIFIFFRTSEKSSFFCFFCSCFTKSFFFFLKKTVVFLSHKAPDGDALELHIVIFILFSLIVVLTLLTAKEKRENEKEKRKNGTRGDTAQRKATNLRARIDVFCIKKTGVATGGVWKKIFTKNIFKFCRSQKITKNHEKSQKITKNHESEPFWAAVIVL